MTPPLPKPIEDYVAGAARLDVDAMLAPFAPDAVVHDDGGRHQGHAELRRWLQDAVVAAEAVFTPDAVRREGEQVVVEGLTHGAFKGSPIRFTKRFTLEDEAIKTLEITA